MSENRSALPAGYRLHWYRIRSVLGQGGFGITYLADDTNLNQPVAIKEYLPGELALRDHDDSIQPITGERGEQFRWGLERFISEAQTLARFKHPNIVRVFTVFTANNSAYMVMEYAQGIPLNDRLKERKTLTQAELEAIAFPVMEGLTEVHAQGFIHRDIKPANIFIRADGSPVLLDFGSARQALGEMTRTLTAMVSPGFAPFEQYTARGEKQGPWTDIYGLGATLYRAAVGKSPADAMDRSEALLHAGKDILVPAREFAPLGFTPAFLAAVDRALAFRTEERPQTVARWREEFAAGVPVYASEVPTEKTPAVVVPTGARETVRITLTPPAIAPVATRGRIPWAGILVGVVLLLAILLVAGKARRHAPEPAGSQPAVTVPADVAAPTPAPATGTSLTAPAPAVSSPESKATQVPAATAPAHRAIAAPPAAPATLLQPEERARLVELQHRLQRKPRDQKSRAEIGALLERLNGRVREAVQAQDYPRAEAYINELLLLAPDNPRLREALTTLREQQRTTRDPKP